MSLKFSQGFYKLKNPEKYVGLGQPRYRSSWEWHVMKMCDENPAIQNWASESVKIPYRDPLTGKATVYVPDFLVVYVNNNKKKCAELWEVKPVKQTPISKERRAIFIVRAMPEADIYNLFSADKDSFEGVAHIPDYKTSVKMNNLFRIIKENNKIGRAHV